MLTGAQIRMARAALKWSVRELAARARTAPMTVSRIENGAEAYADTLQRIRRALEKGGVEFLDGNGAGVGVRLTKKSRKR